MTDTVTARDQLLYDIFTTALEGGINYWAQVDAYHIWKSKALDEDVHGFYAIIRDQDDEDAEWVTVNIEVMRRGYTLATSPAHEWRNRLAWSSDEKPPLVVTVDTEWDYDAGDADCILQLGLFGDVVYG